MNSLTVLVSAVLIAATSAAVINEERPNTNQKQTLEDTEDKLQDVINRLTDSVNVLKHLNPNSKSLAATRNHQLITNLTQVYATLLKTQGSFDPKGEGVITDTEHKISHLISILPHVPNAALPNEKAVQKYLITYLQAIINNLLDIELDISFNVNESDSDVTTSKVHDHGHESPSTDSSVPYGSILSPSAYL